jgi:hypothetical protein
MKRTTIAVLIAALPLFASPPTMQQHPTPQPHWVVGLELAIDLFTKPKAAWDAVFTEPARRADAINDLRALNVELSDLRRAKEHFSLDLLQQYPIGAQTEQDLLRIDGAIRAVQSRLDKFLRRLPPEWSSEGQQVRNHLDHGLWEKEKLYAEIGMHIGSDSRLDSANRAEMLHQADWAIGVVDDCRTAVANLIAQLAAGPHPAKP